MSELAEFSITVDADLKVAAERLFAAQGLKLVDVVTLFLQECVRIGGLPFDIDEEMRALCEIWSK